MARKLAILKRIRKETVVYIPSNGVSMDGTPAIDKAAAREILVRWEDDQIEYTNTEGEREQSRSVVFVGELFNIGDFLYKGSLADFIIEDPEVGGHELNEIKGKKTVPTLDYGDTLYQVFLGPFN